MVTPLGKSAEEYHRNASAGHSGVKAISRFDSSDIDVHVAGQVPEIDFVEEKILSKRDLKNWFSPVIPYSLYVADRALKKSGLQITDENKSRIGITYSSAIGGLDAILTADQNYYAHAAIPHPFTNVNVCLNLIAGKISMQYGTTGPLFSPVAACATGNVSVVNGLTLIQMGLADVVICGAVDFPLNKSVVYSFSSMNGAYHSEKEDDRGFHNPAQISRPFSQDRKGFVISEGAACLIITSLEYAEKNDMAVEAEIKGFALNSDGFHYVFPKTETCAACMQQSLQNAGLNPGIVDCINTHGTSTKIGDKNEVLAMKSVWGAGFYSVILTANKSALGHSMGASSAIELISSLLSLKHGIIYPTLNYLPDPEFNLDNLVTETREKKVNYVLNNSFGFGGTNSCIILGNV